MFSWIWVPMRQVEYDYVLKSIRIIEPGNIRGSGGD